MMEPEEYKKLKEGLRFIAKDLNVWFYLSELSIRYGGYPTILDVTHHDSYWTTVNTLSDLGAEIKRFKDGHHAIKLFGCYVEEKSDYFGTEVNHG